MPVPPHSNDQFGLFTAAQASDTGLFDWHLARAARRGELAKVVRGVYADSQLVEPDADHVMLVRAHLLRAGEGWHAARRTAGWLHGLPLIGRRPTVPQLLRDPGVSRSKARDRHGRIAALPLGHRTSVQGIPTTTVARTVVDVARQEVFRNGVVVADAALRTGCSKGDLRAVLDAQRRWPGVATARRVVDFADGRAESAGESVTRVAFAREGLPVPEPQVEIWRWGEFVARVDLLLRAQLLVVESDGAVRFTAPGVLPALLERHERIRDCGLEVVRTSWAETFKDTRALGFRVRDRMATPRRLAPGVQLVNTCSSLAA